MDDGADQALLEQELATIAQSVEALLERLLPDVDGYEAQLLEAMRYATLAGGKRLRPFLVLASGSLFDVPTARTTRVACALECVHTYSLVHDDLPCMDDDDMRRGKPTIHKKFDEATAVLVGDALLTFAFELIADEATHHDPLVRSDLVLALAREAGAQGMVGGADDRYAVGEGNLRYWCCYPIAANEDRGLDPLCGGCGCHYGPCYKIAKACAAQLRA